MLLNRSGTKRLALESIIALSLAWGSLQLGQVYASEGPCPQGLTALHMTAPSVQDVVYSDCQRKYIASE